jgi:hypothetical protein
LEGLLGKERKRAWGKSLGKELGKRAKRKKSLGKELGKRAKRKKS